MCGLCQMTDFNVIETGLLIFVLCFFLPIVFFGLKKLDKQMDEYEKLHRDALKKKLRGAMKANKRE